METPSFSTASTILTQVRAETRIGSSPTATALQDTAMLAQLSDVNSEGHNLPYSFGMLGWKFNDTEYIIQGKNNTTLDGAIASGATQLTLTSSADFNTPAASSFEAGYIRTGTYIYDFFTYESGPSSRIVSTVDGIQIAHADDEPVHKLYPLPSNYGKPRSMFRQSNVLEYFYFDEDFRQTPPFGYYIIKVLTSSSGYKGSFVVLPESIGEINFKFYYMKKPTSITATTDSINLPDGTGRRWVIEKMCAYVWNILGEIDLAAACETRAKANMEQCLSQWSTYTLQPSQNIQLPSLGFNW